MSNQPSIATIANDAVDQLEVARDCMAWFDSLTWAIKTSFENGHDHHAKKLASLAQYLANDYRDMLECQARQLSEQLSAADLRA
ncbi:hypothetical protein HX870_01985 [Pseudomonas gingeri]|uniref:hypothetical protein n=1 Tax=Pseudomonas gingeri TaxID=117681 RepID=UPI0015A03300|nr:hypothetical protein [Pseudomonas gingeri]NWD66392.1 hypothetical protein [Pseudomonas gingeri]